MLFRASTLTPRSEFAQFQLKQEPTNKQTSRLMSPWESSQYCRVWSSAKTSILNYASPHGSFDYHNRFYHNQFTSSAATATPSTASPSAASANSVIYTRVGYVLTSVLANTDIYFIKSPTPKLTRFHFPFFNRVVLGHWFLKQAARDLFTKSKMHVKVPELFFLPQLCYTHSVSLESL